VSTRSWGLVVSVAWRFLRGKRSELLDGTARSALAATAIGVAAMVIAMALMSGYREDLHRKLLRGNAAVIAYPLSNEWLDLAPDVYERLLALDGVDQVRRVAYGQGSLSSVASSDALEVTLRGEGLEDGLLGLGEIQMHFSPDGRDEVPGVLVGADLERRLAAEPGESLRLMVLGARAGRPHFRYQSVRVAGTFKSGFSEFDQGMVVMDRALLERLMGGGIGGSFFEFSVPGSSSPAAAATEIREALGPDFLVREWEELNAELFAALRLQQLALFFVLGLIVLVSTFNVASSLVVLVRERMRDIGVLSAIGLTPRQVQTIFLLFGLALGLVGTALGVTLGAGSSLLLTRYEVIRFGPEVAAIYFLSSVPFRVEPLDLLAVVGFTLSVMTLACWLPSLRAGRVRPAAALRYE
jgi:lipoprotein-releasing system permease protein